MACAHDSRANGVQDSDFGSDVHSQYYGNCRIVFDWDMLPACNYRCPYCVFGGALGEEERREAAKRARLFPFQVLTKFWEDVFDRHGRCHVQMTGGEPTVYPGFFELLVAMARRHQIAFSTNLWWGVDKWDSLTARLDLSKSPMKIQASFHPTETALDEFLSKAIHLRESGYDLGINVVCHPPALEKLEDLCREVYRRIDRLTLQPFDGTWNGKKYPDAYTEEERAHVYRLSSSINSPFQIKLPYALADRDPAGMPCTAGMLFCHIDSMGDIFRCSQTLRVPGGELGNIAKGFEFYPEPRPCPSHFCRCESIWLVDERKKPMGGAAKFLL